MLVVLLFKGVANATGDRQEAICLEEECPNTDAPGVADSTPDLRDQGRSREDASPGTTPLGTLHLLLIVPSCVKRSPDYKTPPPPNNSGHATIMAGGPPL